MKYIIVEKEEVCVDRADEKYFNNIYSSIAEREKRKDELLDIAKSKQERMNAELHNLRQVCLQLYFFYS